MLKKLGTTLEMWQWEAANCVTDKEFEELLGIVKNILPEGNNLPHTMYEAKKVVFPLQLDIHKIHACSYDCILYGGEYEKLDACLVCDASSIRSGKMILVMSTGSLPRQKFPLRYGDVVFPTNTTIEALVQKQSTC